MTSMSELGAGEALAGLDGIAAIEARINALPIVKLFGARIAVEEAGVVFARIDEVRDFHLGGQEGPVVNGAILMGLLDCAMASSAIVMLRGARCATIDFSIKLMKPVRPRAICAMGNVLVVKGDLLFCEGRVCDSRNRVLVTASAVMKKL